MKQGKKISDLITTKRRAKDYAKLNYIFNLYLDEKYEQMCIEIWFYNEYEFFLHDFDIYLNNNFKKELWKTFWREDIKEVYYENYDLTHLRLQNKKILKRWQDANLKSYRN